MRTFAAHTRALLKSDHFKKKTNEKTITLRANIRAKIFCSTKFINCHTVFNIYTQTQQQQQNVYSCGYLKLLFSHLPHARTHAQNLLFALNFLNSFNPPRTRVSTLKTHFFSSTFALAKSTSQPFHRCRRTALQQHAAAAVLLRCIYNTTILRTHKTCTQKESGKIWSSRKKKKKTFSNC